MKYGVIVVELESKVEKAVRSPEDIFDSITGAELAFKHLFSEQEPEPVYCKVMENRCGNIKPGEVVKFSKHTTNPKLRWFKSILSGKEELFYQDELKPLTIAHRHAKAGEHIMIVKETGYSHNKIGDVLKVNDYNNSCAEVLPEDHPKERNVMPSHNWPDGHWNYMTLEYVVLEGYEPVKKFVPHLERDGQFLGNIGKETSLKTVSGETLCVGDVVITISKETGKIYEEDYVVEDNDCAFVMGCKAICQTCTGWFIFAKKKGYQDLLNGETYSNVKAVIKE